MISPPFGEVLARDHPAAAHADHDRAEVVDRKRDEPDRGGGDGHQGGREAGGGGAKASGLFAGTAAVRAERKLNRGLTVHTKLTATLLPVPMPLRLEPTRVTTGPPEQ